MPTPMYGPVDLRQQQGATQWWRHPRYQECARNDQGVQHQGQHCRLWQRHLAVTSMMIEEDDVDESCDNSDDDNDNDGSGNDDNDDDNCKDNDNDDDDGNNDDSESVTVFAIDTQYIAGLCMCADTGSDKSVTIDTHIPEQMPTQMSVYMSMRMATHVSVHMPVHMSTHRSLHVSLHMSVHMSVQMSIHMSMHISIHVHTPACTHICFQVYTHLYSCPYICLPMYQNMCPDMPIHVHTHVSTHVHTHVSTHVHTHVSTHVHAHAETHLKIQVYAHAHTHANAHIHTHICTHAHRMSMRISAFRWEPRILIASSINDRGLIGWLGTPTCQSVMNECHRSTPDFNVSQCSIADNVAALYGGLYFVRWCDKMIWCWYNDKNMALV